MHAYACTAYAPDSAASPLGPRRGASTPGLSYLVELPIYILHGITCVIPWFQWEETTLKPEQGWLQGCRYTIETKHYTTIQTSILERYTPGIMCASPQQKKFRTQLWSHTTDPQPLMQNKRSFLNTLTDGREYLCEKRYQIRFLFGIVVVEIFKEFWW